MKTILMMIAMVPLAMAADEGNPKIDYAGFENLTSELASVRAAHRVGEDEFLKMAAEPGTVVLDTRSREKFEKRHVKGAVHLNFSDFTEEALAAVIPDKTTRVLIYCNNNFDGDPVHFASKRIEVALNIPTFINLHAYGYENVFELGPLLGLKTTRIPFAGTAVLKADHE